MSYLTRASFIPLLISFRVLFHSVRRPAAEADDTQPADQRNPAHHFRARGYSSCFIPGGRDRHVLDFIKGGVDARQNQKKDFDAEGVAAVGAGGFGPEE